MKKLMISICVVTAILPYVVLNSAANIDIGDWTANSAVYPIVDSSVHSNCAVIQAYLRVKYEHQSNRIKLLFMLELDSFTDESNAGVTMTVNDGEEITLHLNGDAEYNNEEYFAEIEPLFDSRTKTLYMQVTLGIKEGIPERTVLRFKVYDTEGAASNAYTVDITENLPISAASYCEPAKTGNTEVKTTKRAEKSTVTVEDDSTQPAESTFDYRVETVEKPEDFSGVIFAVAGACACIGVGAIRAIKRSQNKRDRG